MRNVCAASLDEYHRPCSGCGICATVCPVKAIKMHFDRDGFYVPTVDERTCLACGRCCTVCQRLKEPSSEALYQQSSVRVYSMKAQDANLLRSVSSGGVAALLAQDAVRRKMSVVGCAYDAQNDQCYHTVANTQKELQAFYGSKYLQSETQEAFSQTLSTVPRAAGMVFGTPCQISGLDQALRMYGIRENFTLVEVFCKGVSSRLLWSSYLEGLHQCDGLGEIGAVNFRDKTKSWREYSLTVSDIKGKIHRGTVYQDFYLMFMVRSVVLRESCYACPFRHHESAADIRLGDFWGPRYYDDRAGVSLVVSFTPEGENALARIRSECQVEDIFNKEEVLISQRFDSLPVWEHREMLLSDLRDGMTLKQANEKYKVTSISIKYQKEKTD